MSPVLTGLLFLASVLGGALNSVVGGGSFVAFPALLFAGVPAVSANATTTFALWPAAVGSLVAYRRDLRQPRRLVVAFSLTSLIGGGLGALLLLGTSDRTFVRLVPWLLLFASLLFSFGGKLALRLGAHESENGATRIALGTAAQLVISIYGGYFGGGMGIVMLALWSVLGMTDLHAMNGLRTLLVILINGVALTAFIVAGAVAWRPGLVMVVGATAAGYFGAAWARRVDPRWVRRFVLAVAWAMTGYFFVRAYG